MSANTRKQLNIRNDEAFATAHDLAAKLGMTTTEIVVSALREFKSKRRISDKLLPPRGGRSQSVRLDGIGAAQCIEAPRKTILQP